MSSRPTPGTPRMFRITPPVTMVACSLLPSGTLPLASKPAALRGEMLNCRLGEVMAGPAGRVAGRDGGGRGTGAWGAGGAAGGGTGAGPRGGLLAVPGGDPAGGTTGDP